METTQVKTHHTDSSPWGSFYDREAELPLVTAMSIYPRYKHRINWTPPVGMSVVEVQIDGGLTGRDAGRRSPGLAPRLRWRP